MGSAISNALCRTSPRLVISLCIILMSFGCSRTVEKFCSVNEETLKQSLIRLVQSPVIKDDDWVNATSITVDSVDSSPLSSGKTQVSFAVRWTTGVGDARTDHSETWQANLAKTADKRCHVTGVAVRSGGAWIKAINTDFEIK
jgi:hypothetical protein